MSIVERETEAPTILPPVTRRDVLHRAADLLEEFGWCQGHYGDKRAGRFCALGAINEATRDLGFPNEFDASHPLYLLLRGSSVVDWNDDPARTKAQVVATLRAVAESA